MTKRLLQRTISLMVLALMTCINVSAKDFTFDFSSKIPAGWTASVNPNGFEVTGDLLRGAQFTTDATLTLANCKNVTKVLVVCSANTTKNSLAISVGNNSWGTINLPKENGMTQTFSGTGSGNLTLSVTHAEKSVYIKKITVTADECGSATGDEDPDDDTPSGDGANSLITNYIYSEPTMVKVKGETCYNASYTFVDNNILVSATTGAHTDSYFGCNAGNKITFTATKNIKAIVVNGMVKKGFEAKADHGTISYASDDEEDVTADPVLAILDVDSKSVTITCEKQLRCNEVAVYFEENPDVELGGGNDELSFKWEPTTPTTMNLKFKEMQYTDYSKDMDFDYTSIILEDEENTLELAVFAKSVSGTGVAPGTYVINSTYEPGTVQASPGGDDEYDYPSYLATDYEYYEDFDAWVYNTSYYLESGTVTVEKATEGVKITINAKTHYGSTINATYVGEAVNGGSEDEGGDDEEGDFSYEPTTPTTLNITFDAAVAYDTTEDMGVTSTEFLFGNDDYQCDMLVFAPTVAKTGIAPGTYVINSTYEPGTVMASPGADVVDFTDYPTFIATDFTETDEGLIYNAAYYLDNGTLTVVETATGCKMTLNGKTHFGSTINMVYEGKVTTALEEEDAIRDAKADNNMPTKLLKDGKIVIRSGNNTYTTSGVKLK